MSNNRIGNIILEGAVNVEDAVIVDRNNRRLMAEGTLQDMDVQNRNGRIYAEKDLMPEVKGDRIKELIATGNLKGEDGHPLSNDLVRQQTIEPKYTSVKFLKLWQDKNKIKARFVGTNTPLGEAFDQDLRDGEKPSFSLRALGSIEKINNKAYVKNIKIITWDRVYYPSHKAAYTEGIVTESAIVDPLTGVKEQHQKVVPVDDPGTIITLRESDAKIVLDRLQRESANISTILETFDGLYDRIDVVKGNKILLTSKYGDRLYVDLDKFTENVIMNYAYKL